MKGAGYCELQVDLSSGDKLAKILAQAGVDLSAIIPVNKLHATIMYDVRNPDIYPELSKKAYTAKIVGVKTLGEPNSKWYSAALELDSPAVQERHKELLKAGYEHSYPDLLLHVSISYGSQSETVGPLLEQLFADKKLPETITLCNETWEVLDD